MNRSLEKNKNKLAHLKLQLETASQENKQSIIDQIDKVEQALKDLKNMGKKQRGKG
jgi:uncharacterized membrane protein